MSKKSFFTTLREKLDDVPLDVKLILVVFILFSASAGAEFSGVFDRQEFVEADVLDVDGTTITLGHECKAIVAQTTPDQARSIRLGLADRIDVRPVTHDVFAETLRGFNITVEEAALTKFEDNIFFGEIVLRQDNKILRIDSRPTDAIATALRTGAPIFINDSVLQAQGQDICDGS